MTYAVQLVLWVAAYTVAGYMLRPLINRGRYRR